MRAILPAKTQTSALTRAILPGKTARSLQANRAVLPGRIARVRALVCVLAGRIARVRATYLCLRLGWLLDRVLGVVVGILHRIVVGLVCCFFLFDRCIVLLGLSLLELRIGFLECRL